MALLRLGIADAPGAPSDPALFLQPLHETGMPVKFRRERNEAWRALSRQDGTAVRDLQTNLRSLGFLPHGELHGVFDYRTRSAVRLFQEYVRSVEDRPGIGKPDGIAGPNTQAHLERWLRENRSADWQDPPEAARRAHAAWLRLLRAVQHQTAARNGPIQQRVRALRTGPRRPDTLHVAEWTFDPGHVHLVGIRRGATEDWKIRINNDVFVLLVGGMTFTFFGSTDPNPGMTRRPPFLVPGQHLYRFGWHKISQPPKCYRAFRPLSLGVLVMRDAENRRHDADLKDEAVLARAIEPAPNPTINIHWSGRHTSSWSAGCQVVSGGGYINHHDRLVDCWDFASAGYAGLGPGTRGAYNVLLDLVTVFTPDVRVQGGGALRYTLIDERDLFLEPEIGRGAAHRALRRAVELLKDRHAKYEEYVRLLEEGG